MGPITRVDSRDGVATITLLRKQALNAFDDALALELRTMLKVLERDESTRVIVVTGSGAAFSAGQDVFEMAREESDKGPRAVNDQLKERFLPVIMRLRSIEKPIIAQVNGVAAGAGLAIALACDFRVASEAATFIMSPIGLGLIPGSGLSVMAPRLVGITLATELFMLGSRIDAARALEVGLLHSVVPSERLADAVHDLALQLVSQPPVALGLTKRALNRAVYHDLETHMRYEAYLQELAAGTTDHSERLKTITSRKDHEKSE